jgi:predicted nucleic acid-binding protein
MITAVDTNVFVDIFSDDAPDHDRSEEWLRVAYDNGSVIACDIVYAELVPSFGDRSALDQAL